MHILDMEVSHASEDSYPRLSPEEMVYAKDFAENLDKHFSSLLLHHMPANLKKIDKKKAGESASVKYQAQCRSGTV